MKLCSSRKGMMGIVLMTAFVLASCSTAPFRDTVFVPLPQENPRAIVERFQQDIPEHLRVLNTAVFKVYGREFTSMGVVDIDSENRLFKVVCLNPMGVKLFELSGDREKTTTHYAIAVLAQRGDIAAAVGTDIRRIFFDLVPSPSSRIWKRKYRISFYQPFGSGNLEYVFAGKDGDLIEKNYYEDGGIVWQASYYEYQKWNGKRIPYGIVFVNYRYGYRLIVKVKEILA